MNNLSPEICFSVCSVYFESSPLTKIFTLPVSYYSIEKQTQAFFKPNIQRTTLPTRRLEAIRWPLCAWSKFTVTEDKDTGRGMEYSWRITPHPERKFKHILRPQLWCFIQTMLQCGCVLRVYKAWSQVYVYIFSLCQSRNKQCCNADVFCNQILVTGITLSPFYIAY